MAEEPDGGRPGSDWSAVHHGIDPAAVPFVRGWLRLVDVLVRPLVALRVPPDAVTAAGLVASVVVPLLAARGWLVAAVVAVLVSVLLDGLDGAVALRTGRVSAYGRALDSACDRVSELAWWVALVLAAGVPLWQAVVVSALTLGVEGWRARVRHHGVLTVWERPSRTILAVVGLAAAGSGVGWTGPVTGGVGVVLAAAGVVQLVVGGRRRA